MPNKSDVAWFKKEFGARITAAVAGSTLTLDMLTAIACQETGYIWQVLRKQAGFTTDKVLSLCVGDTLDRPSTFPTNKADLLAWPRGKPMFDLANAKLIQIAKYINGYKPSAKNPRKFCHGFGIFQYDLQFFKGEPDYFLDRDWERFEPCLDKALMELRRGLKKLGWQSKTELSDYEMACVAIVYNTGRFKPNLGLKQGHKADGKYYGEMIFEYVRLSKSVPWSANDTEAVAIEATASARDGEAMLPASRAPSGTGMHLETVEIGDMIPLRLSPSKTVIAMLPAGHPVQVIGRGTRGGGMVETVLGGSVFQGHVDAALLRKPKGTAVPAALLEAAAAAIPEAHLPHPSGTITKRTQIANALSLTEASMPRRSGTTVSELTDSLAWIIDWLDTEKAPHKRYQPRAGATFCNIYAHDYCARAGAYLPRVWWTSPALVRIAAGEQVEPRYEATVDEIRANGLFRWLRDYGPGFGWRRAASPSELQTEVNGGAVGLIVARRKLEGRSGHIVAVVPETDNQHAVRNAKGEVTKPLQSQAGTVNFRYGTAKLNWWLGDQFAESGFWLHA